MAQGLTKSVNAGRRWLAERGLNLFAVFDTGMLPAGVMEPIRQAGITWARYPAMLLLGHGGRTMWDALRDGQWQEPDPVDSYSCRIAEEFLHSFGGDPDRQCLYPSEIPIPLQRLGSLAGWSYPSPLGMGIHPEYGLWFAYRSAWLIGAAWPPTARVEGVSPCDSCNDKPCVSACPAGAVRIAAAFDLPKCLDHRLQPASRCELRCLARSACPAGVEYRYSEQQLRYHGVRSIASLRR